MVRSVFFYILCLAICGLSILGASEKARKEDRELLQLLKYKWNGPKKYSGKSEALSRVRKLRALLKGDNGKRGEKGRAGKKGPFGKKGPRGVAGPKGERGPAGAPGQEGPRGAPGERGPLGMWETNEGEISIIFRSKPGTGTGFWQAIVMSPSGKPYVARADEASAEDVVIKISPVEMGVYTLCWKNGFECTKAIHLLKEIEVDSSSFNGEHVFYRKLLTSKYGEQRFVSHVVIKEVFK